ncbi:E3 ubiquitin-protein ligase TRIM45-like isoform X2 [Mytilus trossulus]|uniref:E3 ubiquitin-protein ligase TRIM45-like isoform X2 n=1 Tax=Mytilus trossulus TaxID=6551 RepID=UPI0030045C50
MAQVSAKKCSLCDEQNGAYYCYECQQALCTACRNRHGKIPALSGHTVADINTVDLSTVNKKSHCLEHKKEFLFYCVKCDTFICSKCVTSTHYTHPFSEITEIVVKERQKAKENIEELKLKIDAISTLQEKVKTTHFEQLHAKSKQCIEHIESASKGLQSCIESKRSIKTTEVEDNEKKEQENLKVFVDNTDSVHKQYTQILSELENVLLEKHDVTFYSSYRSIDSDIQTLVNIPEEPEEAQVPTFKDEFLYQEVKDYMELKIDNSLHVYQSCPIQRMKIEDLQSENKRYKETLQRELEIKDEELIQLSLDLQSENKRYKETLQRYTTLKNETYQKDAENKKLADKVKTLNKDLEKKDDEIKKKSREIHILKERGRILSSNTPGYGCTGCGKIYGSRDDLVRHKSSSVCK